LRAGVVRVERFALWESAADTDRGATGELELRPMPLCLGQPFRGELRMRLTERLELQEIRLEIHVRVKATVGSGKAETIELGRGRLAGPGVLEPGDHALPIDLELPARYLPTVQLPHAATSAVARITFARPLALDRHLDRDITLCTTTAL
jgi:hypothetical protein